VLKNSINRVHSYKDEFREVVPMSKKKLLITAIGAGVTYLMKNKDARDKLVHTLQNFRKKNR